MVRDEDTGFHTPAKVPFDWAETNFFYCYVPEHRVIAWVYVLARPAIGAVKADIEINGDLSLDPWGAWYIDNQHHLPLPERLEAYDLPNGLSVRAHSIRNYRVDYVGLDRTELHLDVAGLMEPYDIHDPDMDPLAIVDPERRADGWDFAKAYANHFDMTCRVSGTLKVRGRAYDVDCVSTMDHSWGPRPEREMGPMGWVNAHFGEDYALQAIWRFEPRAKPDAQFQLAHGYALVDGRVRGAKAGSLVAHRLGRFPLGYELTLIDVDDRVHRLYGSPLSMHLWPVFGCSSVPTGLLRWQAGARVGYGTAQENHTHDRETGAQLREASG
jgi:hypothetical protein